MPPSERATVGSLIRWLPSAWLGVRSQLGELKREYSRLDVVVHGDTLSTLLGAWVGRRRGVRVIHLESGLTSGRLLDPFPEEISRRLVFRLSDVAMCPSPESAEYMRRFPACHVIDTGGNTILDAIELAGVGQELRDPSNRYLVASLHRFQNLYDGDRLRALVKLIQSVAVHFPVHFVLHPATRKRLLKEGLMEPLSAAINVQLSPRLGYRDFLRLASGAACVLTDGGSNQEELAALGVPTIVMRQRTERLDGLGENAVMEADVASGVEAFVLGGRFEELRRAPRLVSGFGPSQRIADFLALGN